MEHMIRHLMLSNCNGKHGQYRYWLIVVKIHCASWTFQRQQQFQISFPETRKAHGPFFSPAKIFYYNLFLTTFFLPQSFFIFAWLQEHPIYEKRQLILKLRSRGWGSSLLGLRTLDPLLSPPSTWAEIFRRPCLQSHLHISPPTGILGQLLK